jgi:carbon-monoxide dehydrogenase small subunit
MRTVRLTLNGASRAVDVEPHATLVDVLRDTLALTGTKKGCGGATCGACTVLLDGVPVFACVTLAVRCDGREVLTIEGLAPETGALHPLQQAAIDHGAVQCGYCTPGWLLAARALLDHNPHPTRDEVRRAISGNLCRCTGYQKIEEAILAVAAAGPAEAGHHGPR